MQRGKLGWIKFYPKDWLADRVAGCTPSAQGTWLRMLILMHDCETYGVLTIDGKPMSDEFIARSIGQTLVEYKTNLAELESVGVVKRAEDGAIFSKRMIQDAEDRQSCRERQEKHRTVQPPREPRQAADGFAEFWAEYPRHEAHKEAESAWHKHVTAKLVPLLMDRLRLHKASDGWTRDGGQYIPYASTWLNKHRWEDELGVAAKRKPTAVALNPEF